MRWKFKPVSILKQFAAAISVVTMCIAPVAEGAAAANQKKLINQYLKETGLTTKKMTVGEFWRMVRPVYPAKLQNQIDTWVMFNRNQMMPAIEATSFKDADGQEQVRLTMTVDGQSVNITFTNNDDAPVKVNGVTLTKKELSNYNDFNAVAAKIMKQDAGIAKSMQTAGKYTDFSKKSVLSFNEFAKLTKYQQAEYLIRARRSLEAADKVFRATSKPPVSMSEPTNKYEYVLQVLFGENACAKAKAKSSDAKEGDPCVLAGYMTKYGKGGLSCGSVGAKGSEFNEDFRTKISGTGANCGAKSVPCNPLVYGFSSNGSTFCISGAKNINDATQICGSKAPIGTPEQKKALIESYMKNAKGKNVNLVLNEEGKISKEQHDLIAPYLADLDTYLSDADLRCATVPLSDIAGKRTEQGTACEELRKRRVALDQFANKPEPPAPPAPQPPPVDTCSDQGKVADNNGGCVCPPGQKEGDVGEGQAKTRGCLIVEGGGEGDPAGKQPPAKDDCGFWCKNKSWIIPLGIGVAALGLFWWLFKDKSKAKNKAPEYIPPAPVPEPTATVSPSPTSTIIDPPVAPPACVAPNTLVNGICTPPVVVPPVPSGEGGTTPSNPGMGGGVR